MVYDPQRQGKRQVRMAVPNNKNTTGEYEDGTPGGMPRSQLWYRPTNPQGQQTQGHDDQQIPGYQRRTIHDLNWKKVGMVFGICLTIVLVVNLFQFLSISLIFTSMLVAAGITAIIVLIAFRGDWLFTK